MNTLMLANDLFGDFFPRNITTRRDFSNFSPCWRPKVDLKEEKDCYRLSMDLPGLNDKEIKIEFKDGILQISGEKSEDHKENETENYYYQERLSGRFERTFDFGISVKEDAIKASLKNGLLLVELPKVENKQARTIAIS